MNDRKPVPVADEVREANTLHKDVTDPLEVAVDGDSATARIKRGGVREYGKRIARVSGDGFTTFVPASKLDLVIASLIEVREEIEEGRFRVPNCVYCGEEHESVEEAREHFAEAHEGDENRAWPAKFEREWYEPDPRGEIA